MECPPPPGAPTLAAELRRGVNGYNLTVGAVAAAGLGGLLYLATRSLWQAAAGTLALFVLLTALHTFAHGLMGWMFERGLRLHCQGRPRQALRWLALADRPGMDHYDPHGVARAALAEIRRTLADSTPQS